MAAVHVIRCPECDVDLCADPACRDHAIEEWVVMHAELHPLAGAALMLYCTMAEPPAPSA